MYIDSRYILLGSQRVFRTLSTKLYVGWWHLECGIAGSEIQPASGCNECDDGFKGAPQVMTYAHPTDPPQRGSRGCSGTHLIMHVYTLSTESAPIATLSAPGDTHSHLAPRKKNINNPRDEHRRMTGRKQRSPVKRSLTALANERSK